MWLFFLFFLPNSMTVTVVQVQMLSVLPTETTVVTTDEQYEILLSHEDIICQNFQTATRGLSRV